MYPLLPHFPHTSPLLLPLLTSFLLFSPFFLASSFFLLSLAPSLSFLLFSSVVPPFLFSLRAYLSAPPSEPSSFFNKSLRNTKILWNSESWKIDTQKVLENLDDKIFNKSHLDFSHPLSFLDSSLEPAFLLLLLSPTLFSTSL